MTIRRLPPQEVWPSTVAAMHSEAPTGEFTEQSAEQPAQQTVGCVKCSEGTTHETIYFLNGTSYCFLHKEMP